MDPPRASSRSRAPVWMRIWFEMLVILGVLSHLLIHRKLLSMVSFPDDDYISSLPPTPIRQSLSQGDHHLNLSTNYSQQEEENATETETINLRQIPNRTIMFIHVGKSGGSTLQRSFLPQYYKDKSNNVLQRTPVLFPTCHTWNCRTDRMDHNATTLLFVVRNPIERLISAYKFSHPDNCVTFDKKRGYNVTNEIWGCYLPKYAKCFYKDCAPTLEDLANVPFRSDGELQFTGITNSSCREAVRDMVAGRNRKQSTHAFFNYAYYKNVTIDRYYNASSQHEHGINSTTNNINATIIKLNKEILVIRNEHLWEDASRLDRLMGGSGSFNTQQKVTHGSELYHNHTSFLSSQQGYENLCCLLEKEIDAYEAIVRAAENLSRREKDEAVREVENKCGILDRYASRRDWVDACRERLEEAALREI